MQNPVTCNLAEWLETREMTQTALSLRVNQGESAISRYVSGERVPTLYIARRIASVLKTSVVDIWPDPTDSR